MADHKNAFDARLRQALDITTPDLTPAPATWSDLKSCMRKRGSLGHLLSRNGFLPAPVGSVGAINTMLSNFIKPLQDAEAEFPVALDGNNAGMREFLAAVAFKLNSFLEVDEVELDLIRTAGQRKICNHHVEQC